MYWKVLMEAQWSHDSVDGDDIDDGDGHDCSSNIEDDDDEDNNDSVTTMVLDDDDDIDYGDGHDCNNDIEEMMMIVMMVMA